MSLIFSRRRSLTPAQAKKASLLLKLSSTQERELVDATMLTSKRNPRVQVSLEEQQSRRESNKYKDLDYDRFSALAKWYHMPILALVSTKNFKNNPSWIARRLGITTDEAREGLERLIRLGILISDDNGSLKAADDRVELSPKRSESAVREHHSQMMKRAEETMRTQTDDESWKKRDISSLSMAIDPERIPEAKALLKRFKEDLTSLVTEGNVKEVYQFNVQLFPLTKGEL